MEYKGYRLKDRQDSWYEYYYGMAMGNLMDVIDSCQTDDKLELLWRFASRRCHNAELRREHWEKERREARQEKGGYLKPEVIDGFVEYWSEEVRNMSSIVNLIRDVMRIDVSRWDDQCT